MTFFVMQNYENSRNCFHAGINEHFQAHRKQEMYRDHIYIYPSPDVNSIVASAISHVNHFYQKFKIDEVSNLYFGYISRVN